MKLLGLGAAHQQLDVTQSQTEGENYQRLIVRQGKIFTACEVETQVLPYVMGNVPTGSLVCLHHFVKFTPDFALS